MAEVISSRQLRRRRTGTERPTKAVMADILKDAPMRNRLLPVGKLQNFDSEGALSLIVLYLRKKDK